MKKIKQTARMFFVICLTGILLCGTCLSAFAADPADLDLSRTGSISVSLYSDETQSAVTDGSLTLYEVADLTLDGGDMSYVKTAAFSGCEGTLDVEEEGLAGALADYVVENDITGTEQEISGDGSVQFSGLTLGLYLIVQTTESTGYYPIEPFLVTVPIAQGSAWDYSVDASPKVEVYGQPGTTPGTETTDTDTGTSSESETNDEEPGTASGTTDGSSGTGEGGTDSGTTSGTGDSGTDSGTTSDTATPAPTTTPTASSETRLPQTGQLVWPVAVLAIFGGAFFVTGFVLRRKSRAA